MEEYDHMRTRYGSTGTADSSPNVKSTQNNTALDACWTCCQLDRCSVLAMSL